MDIFIKTILDAVPVFIVIGSIAAFIALLYLVVEGEKPKVIKSKRTWDMAHPTRFMSLE